MYMREDQSKCESNDRKRQFATCPVYLTCMEKRVLCNHIFILSIQCKHTEIDQIPSGDTYKLFYIS